MEAQNLAVAWAAVEATVEGLGPQLTQVSKVARRARAYGFLCQLLLCPGGRSVTESKSTG